MDWRYAFNSTSTAFVNATLGSGSDSGSWAGSRSGSATPIQRFGDWYAGWHGYSALLVCSLGALANAMNCVVLTRRAMVSPANVLLTALAIADAATMVSYLPYATYFYVVSSPDPGELHSYWWALYIILQTNFLITCHTAAMYLTVSLAVFRYIVVCHHTYGPTLCSIERAKVTVCLTTIATILFCLPNYIIYTTMEYERDGNNVIGYWFEERSIVTSELRSFNKWTFGVVLKVVPCLLLTVLSALLVRAMREAAERKRKRCKKRSTVTDASSDRTTAVLVAIVACFVVTELPQGVLALLGGLNHGFFESYYVPLGDFMDIVVLVNSSANFILYCTMSAQFRATFVRVFFVWGRSAALLGAKGPAASTRRRNDAGDPMIAKVTQL